MGIRVHLLGTTKVAVGAGSNNGTYEIHATHPEIRVEFVILGNIDGQAHWMEQSWLIHMLTIGTAHNVQSIVNCSIIYKNESVNLYKFQMLMYSCKA